MHCKTFQEQLIPFVDNELCFQEIGKMKQHLQQCSACRNSTLSYGPTPNFSPLFSDTKSQEFWDQYDELLFEKIHARERQPKILRLFSSPSARRMALAAGITIALIIPALLLQPQNPGDDPRFPNPADQGVNFSLTPVNLGPSSKVEFVTPDQQNSSQFEFVPGTLPQPQILENIDYRRDASSGFY